MSPVYTRPGGASSTSGCLKGGSQVWFLVPSTRQVLERKLREELPGQVAAYQRDLAATPAEKKTRREMLEWQIRRAQKRMAEVEARLAGG